MDALENYDETAELKGRRTTSQISAAYVRAIEARQDIAITELAQDMWAAEDAGARWTA